MANNLIVRDFARPSKDLIERFRALPVANIDDAIDRLQAIDPAIRPLSNQGKLLGPAFTVKVAQGDNLLLHAAMDMAKPGDVIVIDAGGYEGRAIFGALMATYLKVRGMAGIVCDGAIRDKDELAELESFPVYARSATPDGPYKNGPGEIGTPVCVGGRIVHPGDIVVGDGDGVLFLDPAKAEAIADATDKIKAMEDGLMAGILQGNYDRPWVRTKLAALGYVLDDEA